MLCKVRLKSPRRTGSGTQAADTDANLAGPSAPAAHPEARPECRVCLDSDRTKHFLKPCGCKGTGGNICAECLAQCVRDFGPTCPTCRQVFQMPEHLCLAPLPFWMVSSITLALVLCLASLVPLPPSLDLRANLAALDPPPHTCGEFNATSHGNNTSDATNLAPHVSNGTNVSADPAPSTSPTPAPCPAHNATAAARWGLLPAASDAVWAVAPVAEFLAKACLAVQLAATVYFLATTHRPGPSWQLLGKWLKAFWSTRLLTFQAGLYVSVDRIMCTIYHRFTGTIRLNRYRDRWDACEHVTTQPVAFFPLGPFTRLSQFSVLAIAISARWFICNGQTPFTQPELSRLLCIYAAFILMSWTILLFILWFERRNPGVREGRQESWLWLGACRGGFASFLSMWQVIQTSPQWQ
eukprot:gene2340-3168_t